MVSTTQELVLWVVAILMLFANSHEALLSNLAGRAACAGENVILTCDILEAGILTWIIGSSDNTIDFELSDDSSLTTQTDSTGQFTASLIHYSRDQQYSFLGNLTSTLHTHINPSIIDYPVIVYCNDGIREMTPSFELSIAGNLSKNS